jgi:peptidoglycan/LPS O-acetylase OafA/YrhL
MLAAGGLGHFWSLAVEEQFYICWPTLVLFLPRAWLGRAFLAAVFSAPVFRLVVYLLTGNAVGGALTPACLDTLGAGALLALLQHRRGLVATGRVATHCLWSALAGFAVLWSLQLAGCLPHAADLALGGAFVSLAGVWAVNRAAVGFGGVVGAILSSRPVVYLGSISYGIYVWHNFIAWFVSRAQKSLGIWLRFPFEHGAAQFLCVTCGAVAMASFSWFLLEKPLNSLKQYFPYNSKPARKTGPAPAPLVSA